MADKCAACGKEKTEREYIWMFGGQRCLVCGRVSFKEPKLKEQKKVK